MPFWYLLKELRIEARMTQKGFAAFLGVPASTYKTWERDVCLPCFANLELLIKKLKGKTVLLEQAFASAKLD